jgi:hypothetical protein
VISSSPDAADLLDQYEGLRREVLGTGPRDRSGHGLALFISRGMAAWINAVSILGRKPGRPALPVAEASPVGLIASWPTSLKADLTAVLADMVLTCTQETQDERTE